VHLAQNRGTIGGGPSYHGQPPVEEEMRTKSIVSVAAVALAAVGFWTYRRADAHEPPAFRYATIARGDVKSVVAATGTLSAVTTVQVGTQVSGQIAQLYVDFNDQVRKGQLLARIDPTLQLQAVTDAQATLERSQAQLEQAQREYDRNKQLYDGKVLTESEFNTTQYNLSVGKAAAKSAQVALDRARQNLAYTSIHAPIDGVVVERNVDVGQTVAASLSAPQLFLIANDLSQMQILASVDESDIGSITEGAPAQFRVQTYPNQQFAGTVRQVRLQSTTTENVVSYTVVVSVKNPNGKLLPGMTATVQFQTGAADAVLTVPNAALRFRPTPEMLAQLGGDTAAASAPQRPALDSATRDSLRKARMASGGGMRASGGFAQVWYLDASGKLVQARVRTGLTDGQKTEITGQSIRDGMQVIAGAAQAETAAANAAATTNPLQPRAPQGAQRRGPGGGGGF
jgi:HlyD family secretion protein